MEGATVTTTFNPSVPSAPINSQSVSSLFAAMSTAATSFGTAAASGITATGDAAEAAAYGNASSIASQNALLAISAGDVEQAQAQRQINQTVGSQIAGVAGNGFAEAGSAIDLLRSSKQQGLLNQQIIGTNTDIAAGGFEEQAAGATAEQQAAGAAGSAATVLGTQAQATGVAAQTTAVSEAAALSTLATPAQKGTLSTLSNQAAGLNATSPAVPTLSPSMYASLV